MSKRINRDDIDKYHDFGLYLPTRAIYIGSTDRTDDDEESGTDYKMAERAIKNLHILDSVSSQEIVITMNNLGGHVEHGLAIYDAIKACRSPVTVIGTGPVMSMGAWILQAADTRVLTPSARVMIHYGSLSFSGHTKNAERWAEDSKKLNKMMEDCFLDKIQGRHLDFTRARLQKLLNFDTILSAGEAVALGLADNICNEDPE